MKPTLLLIMALAPMALRADPQLCRHENATLKGTYVISVTGTAGGAIFNNQVGPFAALGTIVYDGTGGLQSTQTLNVLGNIVRGFTATGGYTVNGDCTGTMAFGSGSSAVTFDIVATPDGRQVSLIQTNQGPTTTGTAVRLDHGPDRD